MKVEQQHQTADRPLILVVEDEPVLRRAIAIDLERKGYRVLEAKSGKEALEVVKKEKVKIVLSDVRMPDGDGLELLDAIKSMNPEIPDVILITGFADISVAEAYNKGARAVFSKPFDRKALHTEIERAINPTPDGWIKRKSERVKMDLEIGIQLEENAPMRVGRLTDIGIGGIFVALDLPLPNIADQISFQIRLGNECVPAITSTGEVRWTRLKSGESLPSGFGIKFVNLSENSRKNVIELINWAKTQTSISKANR